MLRRFLSSALLLAACDGELGGAAPEPTAPRCSTPLTDVTVPMSVAALGRPSLRVSQRDGLGGCVERRTDGVQVGAATLPSPGVQPLDAGETALLTADARVLDASTGAVLLRLDQAASWRWDPLAARTLWGVTERALLRRALDGEPQTVLTADGLRRFLPLESGRDLAFDGSSLAILGEREDGGYELWWVRVDGTVLSRVRTPTDSVGRGLRPSWVAVSGSGAQLVVQWPVDGAAPFHGVESFDESGVSTGLVSTGHGAGDLALGADGTDYYVVHDRTALVRWGVPAGYSRWLTGEEGARVELASLGVAHSTQLSCRSARAGWCATLSFAPAGSEGSEPLANELFLVSLDSRTAAPRLERLLHHRSDELRRCADGEAPRAASSPGGDAVWLSTNWGSGCGSDLYRIAR